MQGALLPGGVSPMRLRRRNLPDLEDVECRQDRRPHLLRSVTSDAATHSVYALLVGSEPKLEGAGAAFDMLKALLPIADGLPIWSARFSSAGRTGRAALLTAIDPAVLIAEYLVIFDRLSQRFASIPTVDFVREKGRLETLNTSRLAHQLDSRFLKFAEENRATAAALGGVIKQRAQFPTDQIGRAHV